MKKGMKRTLLAFMVMAMLASTAAVPAMASAVPDGEGVVGQVLGATHSNGDEGVQPRATYVAQIGNQPYESFDAAFTAATSGSTIQLLSSTEYNGTLSLSDKSVTIDLGGNTLTVTGKATSEISNGVSLTLQNGSVIYNDLSGGITNTALLAEARSTITLQNANLSSNCTALMANGSAAAVNVINSTVVGNAYAIGTNAGDTANYNVTITLQGSNISVTGEDNCAVLFNVPGQLNIEIDIRIAHAKVLLCGRYCLYSEQRHSCYKCLV